MALMATCGNGVHCALVVSLSQQRAHLDGLSTLLEHPSVDIRESTRCDWIMTVPSDMFREIFRKVFATQEQFSLQKVGWMIPWLTRYRDLVLPPELCSLDFHRHQRPLPWNIVNNLNRWCTSHTVVGCDVASSIRAVPADTPERDNSASTITRCSLAMEG